MPTEGNILETGKTIYNMGMAGKRGRTILLTTDILKKERRKGKERIGLAMAPLTVEAGRTI